MIDSVVYIVAFTGNLAVVPQAVKAWGGPSPGMAITTWVMFTVITFIWLVYALLHHEKPLIVAQIGALVVNLAVVVGWLFNNI